MINIELQFAISMELNGRQQRQRSQKKKMIIMMLLLMKPILRLKLGFDVAAALDVA